MAAESFAYIGTYTGGESQSKGIYVASWADGKLGPPQLAGRFQRPSFLVLHPTRPLLFSVAEVSDFDGQPAGGVVGWAIQDDGTLKRTSTQPTGGGGACHLSLTRDGGTLLVANYGGGSVASYPITDDGKIGGQASFHQHTGGSRVVANRQGAPHCHSIHASPDGRFAFVPDLGLDQIKAYRLADSVLTPAPDLDVDLSPGGGPRHFDWHPDGQQAFCNLELGSAVTRLTYDAESGQLTPHETLSTLPEGYDDRNGTAECLVSPDGRFVFVSNRGHDSVAVFAVGGEGGFTRVGLVPAGAKTPRGMGLSPDGTHLIVCGQGSGNVRVMSIGEDGSLTPAGSEISVDRPVNIRIRPAD